MTAMQRFGLAWEKRKKGVRDVELKIQLYFSWTIEQTWEKGMYTRVWLVYTTIYCVLLAHFHSLTS